MLDGILLEQRGIPAAVICTELFVPNGRATAKAHGAPDYPFALVPHPMASASPAELARQAKEVLPAVLRLLVRG